MALLAEQKRKVKHGLDPQNMSWSNDNSKIGQRMMEKMGWAKGKGLGANESGMTEHIKASYKSDTKGLGSTPQTVDAWIAHQDDFNDLLKMLNSQSEADAPVVEKTEKEKHVDGHKRYYGRFARGQAQTLRSVDDLNCIFGRRKSKSDATETNEHSATNSGSDEPEEKRHGLTTVTSTSSVQEYFAKKMAEMKARKKENGVQDDTVVDGNEAAGGTTTDKYKTENKSVYGAVNFSYNNGDDKAGPSPDSSNGTDSEKKSRGWYNNFTKDNSDGDLQESSTIRKKRKKDKHGSDDNDSNVEVKKSRKKERKDKTINDSESNNKVPKSLEMPSSASKDEENMLPGERKKSERNTSHKSTADIECTDGADEKSERKKKKKSKREQINSDDEKSDSALPAQPKRKYKDKKINSDTHTSSKAHTTNKPGTDSTDTLGDSNEMKNCDSADDTQENKRKKKQKRKHSQIDEECSPVQSSKKKKKRRKDTCDNEPEEDTAGNVNTESKDALSGKEETHKEDTGNKETTIDGIFSPQELRKHEKRLRKKERKKKKELKKAKQDSASNNLFSGSNIAEIVGYGIPLARKSKTNR